MRSALDLKSVPVVLFHSPADHLEALLAVLEAENDDWTGRALVICETELDDSVAERFRRRGASVARVTPFELPGYLVIHGTGAALAAAHRLARELRLHPIEVKPGTESAFNAAVTLGTCALTPVLDAVATLLREAGLREAETPKLAAAIFLKTAREYAHSGKQSWGWYAKSPDARGLLEEIAGAGPETGPMLRQLILLGMKMFGKHPEVAAVIQKSF